MEEKITIDIAVERIQEAFKQAADEVFKSSYTNPVKDLLESSIKEKAGEISKVVNEIITEALSNPEFKAKISDVVIQRMVQSALKDR